MLTPLDDSLWHQIASPFENVGTSDHRFFDRMWFAVYDPGGIGRPAVHDWRLQQHERD